MRPRTVDRVHAREKIREPAKRFLRLPETRPREVQLLAVVRRQQQIPHGGGTEAAGDDVGNGVRIPERLRHFLLVDNECSTWTQNRENGFAHGRAPISFS